MNDNYDFMALAAAKKAAKLASAGLKKGKELAAKAKAAADAAAQN